MNDLFFFVAFAAALALAALLVWALRGASQRSSGKAAGLGVLENAPRHLASMPQIRQALDVADLRFAAEKGGPRLAAKLKSERRKITLLYLESIRADFEQLLRIARVIAVLSPEVSGSHEYERLRLTLIFRLRYQVIRIRLQVGNVALPEVGALGQMVTSLGVEMEAAMSKLGERAALAAELALQSDH
jgi:hypothetical protein